MCVHVCAKMEGWQTAQCLPLALRRVVELIHRLLHRAELLALALKRGVYCLLCHVHLLLHLSEGWGGGGVTTESVCAWHGRSTNGKQQLVERVHRVPKKKPLAKQEKRKTHNHHTSSFSLSLFFFFREMHTPAPT